MRRPVPGPPERWVGPGVPRVTPGARTDGVPRGVCTARGSAGRARLGVIALATGAVCAEIHDLEPRSARPAPERCGARGARGGWGERGEWGSRSVITRARSCLSQGLSTHPFTPLLLALPKGSWGSSGAHCRGSPRRVDRAFLYRFEILADAAYRQGPAFVVRTFRGPSRPRPSWPVARRSVQPGDIRKDDGRQSAGSLICVHRRSSDFPIACQVVKITKTLSDPVSQITE